jgi:hypothetical protein
MRHNRVAYISSVTKSQIYIFVAGPQIYVPITRSQIFFHITESRKYLPVRGSQIFASSCNIVTDISPCDRVIDTVYHAVHTMVTYNRGHRQVFSRQKPKIFFHHHTGSQVLYRISGNVWRMWGGGRGLYFPRCHHHDCGLETQFIADRSLLRPRLYVDTSYIAYKCLQIP